MSRALKSVERIDPSDAMIRIAKVQGSDSKGMANTSKTSATYQTSPLQ